MAVTLVARGNGSSLSWLGGSRMMGSFSLPRPVSCQRLCTSDLACAWLQFSSQPGQVTGFPSQPFPGVFHRSLLPRAMAVVIMWAATSTSQILPLAFMLQWEGVQSPAGGANLPPEEWPWVHSGVCQDQGLPMQWGCLTAIAGGNSSSALHPVTTASHIHVSNSLRAIKAAKNWSKQDTFCMFWQESFVSSKWKGNPLATQIQSLLLSLLKLNSTSV